jgi:hypothetical protein
MASNGSEREAKEWAKNEIMKKARLQNPHRLCRRLAMKRFFRAANGEHAKPQFRRRQESISHSHDASMSYTPLLSSAFFCWYIFYTEVRIEERNTHAPPRRHLTALALKTAHSNVVQYVDVEVRMYSLYMTMRASQTCLRYLALFAPETETKSSWILPDRCHNTSRPFSCPFVLVVCWTHPILQVVNRFLFFRCSSKHFFRHNASSIADTTTGIE